MWTLIVYECQGKRYVAQMGPAGPWYKKEDVLIGGAKEIFSVSQATTEPFIELLRKMLAEVDKKGIRNVIGIEDLLCRAVAARRPDAEDPSRN
ncbi:MAG TPA: hypothetical protein VI937_01865 [Negativicutes bacterium]|nr:hypothetical protein [Negativicutes bacterium]